MVQNLPNAPESGRAAPWMVTFADLLSLMLTFFVLLFSMSEVKVEAWQMVVEALSVRLQPLEDRDARPAPAQRTVPKVLAPNAIDLGYLRAVLDEKLAESSSYEGWVLTLIEDRIVISLPSDKLFDPGTAVLTESARTLAADLSSVLSSVRNQIDVNAYLQPGTAFPVAFKSGWAFSTARAVAFAGALGETGYDRPVAALGFSDSRFDDISDQLDPDRRNELARRVDVVIRRPG